MRRTLLPVVLAVVAATVPAAAKPKPPAVAAHTVVSGVGSVSVDVTVPKGVSLLAPAPGGERAYGFAQLFGDSSWAAVALVSRTARYGGRPVNAVHVHTARPDHCPSSAAPTTGPVPPCHNVVEHSLVNGPAPVLAGKLYRYALPPGTYQVVVSGQPGRFVGAVLSFAGVYGGKVVSATRRVTASFQRVREENVALAHVTGSFSRRLTANGIGVLGLWHTAAGDPNEPGEFTYAECVTPGAAAPLNPDDCTAVAAANVYPADVAKKPVFFASSAGGFTLTNSGHALWETPVLEKGTYTNSFRITRGGRGPAAGAFVWWLQADSLK